MTVTAGDCHRCWRAAVVWWLDQRDERRYSFVDATNFAVMRRLRLDEALAFDADFTSAGFTELRLPG